MTAYGRNKVPELDLFVPMRAPWLPWFAPCFVHWKNVFLTGPSHDGHWEPSDGTTSFLYHEKIGYYMANVEWWKCQYTCVVKNLVYGSRQS